MKKFCALYIVLCYFVFSFSQGIAQSVTFIKTFDHDQFDFGFSAQQTSDGGFMLFGESGHNNSITGVEQYMNLVKTDNNGNVLWNSVYGTNGLINFGVAAKQTFDNGFILCGSFGNLTNDSLALVKTDSMGVEMWHQTYSAHNNRDVGQSVLQTTDSGFIAVGFEGGGLNPSVYVVKTDVTGALQWSKSFSQSGYELGQCIKPVGNNGYIVCGRTNSKGHGQFDIYLMRINSIGDSLWTKTFGTDSSEYGNAVDVTSDGGFIVVGEDYFPGGDIWLIKTDSLGSQEWVKKYGGTGWDFGNDVKQCTNGDFVIAGRKEVSTNNNQFYCLRVDSTGILLWDHVFPAGLLSEAHSVSQNIDGGFIFLGEKSNTTGDSTDYYYLLLDSSGSVSLPFFSGNNLNQIVISPNPTNGIFTIYMNSKQSECGVLKLFEATGKKIIEMQVNRTYPIQSKTFDLSEFKSGVYFLMIEFKDGIITKKILKE